MTKYIDFDGIKGYKTVENAKRAADKKLAKLDRTVWIIITVNPQGRYIPVVLTHGKQENFNLLHQGFCIV